jgi:hypothetical protein
MSAIGTAIAFYLLVFRTHGAEGGDVRSPAKVGQMAPKAASGRGQPDTFVAVRARPPGREHGQSGRHPWNGYRPR